MNENLNLVEILKDCPKGKKLYSTIYGEVKFDRIVNGSGYPVKFVKLDGIRGSVTAQGLMLAYYDGECTLFPSREERNWDLFTVPGCKKGKFDPKTLRPFDRVLVRDRVEERWRCGIFSHIINECVPFEYHCIGSVYEYCIPYNDETKHLVNTADEAPEYYRYWED